MSRAGRCPRPPPCAVPTPGWPFTAVTGSRLCGHAHSARPARQWPSAGPQRHGRTPPSRGYNGHRCRCHPGHAHESYACSRRRRAASALGRPGSRPPAAAFGFQLDGAQRISGHNLTRSPADHRDLRRWLWTVHLSDSPRALISAGRWQHALTHLQRHNGIGLRMLDGRQVAVIAHCTAGDTDTALKLLHQTTPAQPWEHAVTACLTGLCGQHAHLPSGQDLTAMVDTYRQLTSTANLAVFHTRLGLSVIDAAGGVEHPAARRIAHSLISHAACDGYAAREVLHGGCAAILTGDQARTLTQLLDRCALGHQNLPAGLEADLSAALGSSGKVISCALTSHAHAE